jgi:hypothetical protein
VRVRLLIKLPLNRSSKKNKGIALRNFLRLKLHHVDGPTNRSANLLDGNRAEFLFEDRPVDAIRQTEQRMSRFRI